LTSSPDLKCGDFTRSTCLDGRRAELRFTVHRPPDSKVSLRWHRPSGGDVAGRVHVCVARPGFAGDAREDRLALAVFGCDMPARGASLRRVRSRDPFEPARSLVVKPGNQPAPCLMSDCTVEPPFLGDPNAGLVERAARRAGHRPHIEVLNSNRVEAARKISRGLFDPVAPSVGVARFEFRDRQLGASSPVGAALGACEALLEAAQPNPLTWCQARGVQQFPGGQCGRHRHTTIDTDHAAIPRTQDRFGNVRERNMPATGSITSDAIGLQTSGHGSRPAESDPADLGHPYPSVVPGELFNVRRLKPDLPEAFVHASLAPRWTAMVSGEKVPHGLREVPQSLLLHSLRPGRQPIVFGTNVGQLRALLVVSRSAAAWLPKLLLLHGQIPHKAGMPAVLQQHHLLSGSRQQPEPAHTENVTVDTDNIGRRQTAGFQPKELR